MISLIILTYFFFILVLFYPAVSLVLCVSAWLLKQWSGDKKNVEIIDKKTDSLKELVFIISVFFIFFIVAPFVVFCMILAPL